MAAVSTDIMMNMPNPIPMAGPVSGNSRVSADNRRNNTAQPQAADSNNANADQLRHDALEHEQQLRAERRQTAGADPQADFSSGRTAYRANHVQRAKQHDSSHTPAKASNTTDKQASFRALVSHFINLHNPKQETDSSTSSVTTTAKAEHQRPGAAAATPTEVGPVLPVAPAEGNPAIVAMNAAGQIAVATVDSSTTTAGNGTAQSQAAAITVTASAGLATRQAIQAAQLSTQSTTASAMPVAQTTPTTPSGTSIEASASKAVNAYQQVLQSIAQSTGGKGQASIDPQGNDNNAAPVGSAATTGVAASASQAAPVAVAQQAASMPPIAPAAAGVAVSAPADAPVNQQIQPAAQGAASPSTDRSMTIATGGAPTSADKATLTRQAVQAAPVVAQGADSATADPSVLAAGVVGMQAGMGAPVQSLALASAAPGQTAADDSSIVEQVTQSIASARPDGGSITINLNPPELGHVRITLQSDGGDVRGIVEADNLKTLGSLQQEASALTARLADQGVHLVRMEFVDRASSFDRLAGADRGSSDFHQNSNQAQAQAHGGNSAFRDGAGQQANHEHFFANQQYSAVYAAGGSSPIVGPYEAGSSPFDRTHVADNSINVWL